MANFVQTLASASCLLCLPDGLLRSLRTEAIRQLAIARGVPGSMTPQALMDRAACWLCFGAIEDAQTQLWIEIRNAIDPGADQTIDQLAASSAPLVHSPGISLEQAEAVAVIQALAPDGTPQGLANSGACFLCLSCGELDAIATQLLAEILHSIAAGPDTSPSAIIGRSRCVACLPGGVALAIRITAIVQATPFF